MSITTLVKSIQDIMRQDAGVDGDAQRISQLVWMLFLKIYDDKEVEYELDPAYVSPIPDRFRWRSWAADDEGMTGDELLAFVNNDLFPGLKGLQFSAVDDPRGYIVQDVFTDAYNYMKSGTLIRQVINQINQIDFNSMQERHLFNDLYEKILRDLQSAGNACEYYTPRAVTQFGICDPVKKDFGSSESSTSVAPPLEQQNGGLKMAVDSAPADNVAPAKGSKSLAELRFDEVKVLHQQGLSERAIAQRLSMSRKTVHRYMALDAYRRRTPGRQSTSKATTFLPYLHKRWQEGCRNVKQLFTEIQHDGFAGSYASVWRLASRNLCADAPNGSAKLSEAITPRLSANQAAWLLIRSSEELDEMQTVMQRALLDVSTVAAQAYPLAQDFRQLINERQADGLDPWLCQAKRSGIPELRRFATSLQSDHQVVKNALLYPWSNGQVEGQVNRLKLIKRHMYGRAGFDLLRRKVLCMA